MSLQTTVAPSAPTKRPDRSHREVRYEHNAASVLAILAGATFTVASAATNLLYGISKSPELPSQIVWGSVAVAASLALALAPSALMRAFALRSVVGVVFSFAALALFGAFSLSGALGSAFGSRATSQTEQSDHDGTRTRLQRAYDVARGELDGMPSARPVSELQALVTKLRSTPGANGCTKEPDGPISRKACGDAATAEVELGRARRRAELETTMADATAALGEMKPTKIANADATALSTFAGKLGVTVSAESLNPWLALLAVLLMEFGGGLSFVLAGVLSAQLPTRGATSTEHPVTAVPTRAQIHVASTEAEANEIRARLGVQPVSTPAPSKLVVPDDFAGRLVSMLRDRGGELYSGHRALGRALGCSPAHVGNVLRELAEAGRVTVKATKTGTVVRLAA